MQAWIYSTTKIGQRFPGILLTPTATSTLSPADSKTILSKGLAVIDCSWNHLDKTAVHRAEVFFEVFRMFGELFSIIFSSGCPYTDPLKFF
uniref:16S/18S rRNA aminocarboxypropyltransferase Tsr3 C-terminal domain-containing protein n=1 Tax=Meloidogyne incognita TaxID=6306 RepID=A0A914KV42_MELIC